MAASIVLTDHLLSPSHPASVVPSKILVRPGGIGKMPAAGLAGPPTPLLVAASAAVPASGAPMPAPVLEASEPLLVVPASEPPLELPPAPPVDAPDSPPVGLPPVAVGPDPPVDGGPLPGPG